MLLQLFHELVASLVLPLLAQYDGGLHHHSAYFVGNAGDGTLYDGGVGHQCTFHLKGADTIA